SFHTCELTGTGGVKCWGQNDFGQLGDGSLVGKQVPVDVSGLTTGVAAISAASQRSCALTTGGGVKGWGVGTLGTGTTTVSRVPVDATGLTTGVGGVAVGDLHACVVMTGGGVKCWGNNVDGRVGDGTTTQRLAAVDVTGIASGATAVAAGNNH